MVRPLVQHRGLSALSVILHLAAFLLILLVGLSLPIYKPVYILSLESTTQGQPSTNLGIELRFGVWGVCATSALDPPTTFTNPGECTSPQLGYTVPPSLLALIGISSTVTTIVLKGLLVILALHLVSAGISLVALIFSLFLASDALSIIALILSIVAGIVTAVVFAVDIAIVIAARGEVATLTQYHFAVGIGNGVWMVLASMILTWISVIVLSVRVCFCCGLRRCVHMPLIP